MTKKFVGTDQKKISFDPSPRTAPIPGAEVGEVMEVSMEDMLFDCEGDPREELDVGFALRMGEEDDSLYEPAILDFIIEKPARS